MKRHSFSTGRHASDAGELRFSRNIQERRQAAALNDAEVALEQGRQRDSAESIWDRWHAEGRAGASSSPCIYVQT